MSERQALLLYDGTCGFCAESVQFVLRHESAHRTLRFASLQSPTGTEIRGRHPGLDAVDSVIWYEPGEGGRSDTLLVRSAAGLAVLRYLGGIWRVFGVLGAIVPRMIRDGVYDFIARHRHKLVRGGPVCVLPSPDQRERFLDFTVEETVASR